MKLLIKKIETYYYQLIIVASSNSYCTSVNKQHKQTFNVQK